MIAIFAWLIALLLIALLLLWLICFPEAREALGRHAARLASHAAQRLGRLGGRFGRAWRRSAHTARDGGGQLGRHLVRHRLLLLGLIALLALPPLLVVSLRGRVMLEGYGSSDEDDRGNAALVTVLLKGEQLVPPPPLPPEVFTTPEVEMVRPDLGTASREWVKLDADFRQRLLVVFKVMKERYGYDMALLEGYRSPERQAMLASKGKSVTNAGAYQSYHQFGLAADCAFYRNGKLVISEKDSWAMRGYQLYGQVAEAAGLTWGGRWKLLDFGHTELHKPGAGPRRG
jgi:peptidoglycan L-alanyl-D-glutamate endopeptidase CwlK